MDDRAGFDAALARERARNARQIAAFRFYGVSGFLLLQLFFEQIWEGWSGAPNSAMGAVTLFAFVLWRIRARFDHWSALAGLSTVFLDIPMAFWMIRAASISAAAGGETGDATATIMLLPLAYAVLITIASLALDTRQTILAALTAAAFQTWALAEQHGRDLTFLALMNAFTGFVTVVCIYWRTETVRLVGETANEQLRRARLGRYFSPQVAALVEEGAIDRKGERREVTVLFADIRGFTKLAEKMDARDVVVLLNRYLSAMVEIVFAHGGTLDKYMGDGLMAYFGAPVAQPDHARQAVRCALDMQDALASLNERDKRTGETALRMGIGVHTGSAVIGDIGAESRSEFTVIGDTVNVAARLEQLTKDYPLGTLLSGATVAASGGGIPVRLVDTVTLRGRSEPIDVYTTEAAKA